jgi:hypothetical protein
VRRRRLLVIVGLVIVVLGVGAVTQLGSDELQIDMTNSPYPVFAGLVPLCLDGSPAQTQDVCGA